MAEIRGNFAAHNTFGKWSQVNMDMNFSYIGYETWDDGMSNEDLYEKRVENYKVWDHEQDKYVKKEYTFFARRKQKPRNQIKPCTAPRKLL